MDHIVKKIVILGSTGSIGSQTLDVVRAFPDYFEVVGLCNGFNSLLLRKQINEFQPEYIHTLGEIKTGYGGTKIAPVEDIVSLPDVDLVVVGTVGCAGMSSTVAAIEAGKTVCLANKEVIVMSGPLLLEMAKVSGATILTMDSEPSAIWQCLVGEVTPPARLIITASGGAFRDRTWGSLHEVTPEQALNHPTWVMGEKITIDTATLVNKAFEVIESRWLFDVPFDSIDVTIHRQSIVHSMVEFSDGTLKAQMGPTDMGHVIQYALFYPERRSNGDLPKLDAVSMGSLTFEDLDRSLYPCFELAMEYGKMKGTYPAVLAGADEAAVKLFLERNIRFTQIPDVISKTLAIHRPIVDPSISDIVDAAGWALENTLAQHISSTIMG